MSSHDLEWMLERDRFHPTPADFGRVIYGVPIGELEDGGTYVALGWIDRRRMLAVLNRMFREDGVSSDVDLSIATMAEFRPRYATFWRLRGRETDWECRFGAGVCMTPTQITTWEI